MSSCVSLFTKFYSISMIRLLKYGYFKCLLGTFALFYCVSLYISWHDTYMCDRINGFWRNYVYEVSLGYSGTYVDYVRSIYIANLWDSFLMAIVMMACLFAVVLLFTVIRRILKRVVSEYRYRKLVADKSIKVA